MAVEPRNIRQLPPGIAIPTTLIVLILTVISVMLLALVLKLYATEDGGNHLQPMPPASCGPTFRGADDFAGDWAPLAYPSVLGGKSTFDGTMIFSNADADIVDDVLPAGWSLAEPDGTAAGCHPIIVMFGRQKDLGIFVFDDWTIDIGGSDDAYTEMMLLIPFVKPSGAGGSMLHTYVVRMYLDDAAATDIGNDYYGYAKELAGFAETNTASASNFTVLQGSLPMFYAKVSNFGPWQNFGSSTLPNIDEIAEIFRMPLIGKLEVRDALTNAVLKTRDQCSYFEFEFTTSGAAQTRVRGVDVEQKFLKPFVPDMTLWSSLGGVPNTTDGAVQIQNLGWKIGFPPHPFCFYQ